ncbi:MAG: lysylphosphatidylglycerol synthase transmembrane domain-containing protein [Saccharospirillum sp.]
MTQTQRRSLVTLALWLLALALAGWTLSRLPLGDIAQQLSRLSWPYGLLWALINGAIFYLAVKRWQLLGHTVAVQLSLGSLFRLRQAGSAVSFLTPGPHFGGEPLQLYWLHSHFRQPLPSAVATLGLDRFMETGTNITVLLGGVLILLGTAILPVQDGVQIALTLAATLLVMLATTAWVLRHPQWLARRFRPLLQQWRQRTATADAATTGGSGWQALVDLINGAVQQQRGRLVWALLLSLGGWGALLLELALLLNVFGLTPSITEVLAVMVGMRLAMLLPVPGGIGTIEASLFWSFQFLGFPASAALGLIALIRLRDALVLLVGLGCLWSFHRLRWPGRAASLD